MTCKSITRDACYSYSFQLSAHVTVPQTDMGSQVIKGYTILSKGGPPPPWAPQLRPHLFSNNMLDFDGTGFMMTGGEPVLELDLHRLYLVRGLKLLGKCTLMATVCHHM